MPNTATVSPTWMSASSTTLRAMPPICENMPIARVGGRIEKPGPGVLGGETVSER